MSQQIHHVARLGVCVVAFKAREFIVDCLESLLANGAPGMKVVIVDNNSGDGTADVIREWATSETPSLRNDWPFGDWRAPRPIEFAEYGPEGPPPGPLARVTLWNSGANLGFAGASNLATNALLADPAVEAVWNLNPDTLVEAGTAMAFARAAALHPEFGVLGGRVVYHHRPDLIQLDGGILRPFSKAIASVNPMADRARTPLPEGKHIDFVTGASMVTSRAFSKAAGEMEESYFLYFDEIDWQMRRGDLKIVTVPDAIVRHHAGAVAGSGQKPSAFSTYFTARNTMRFIARWFPGRLPLAYAFAWIRALRRSDGTWSQFAAFLSGLHQLPPPRQVRQALPEQLWRQILGEKGSM